MVSYIGIALKYYVWLESFRLKIWSGSRFRALRTRLTTACDFQSLHVVSTLIRLLTFSCRSTSPQASGTTESRLLPVSRGQDGLWSAQSPVWIPISLAESV